MLFPLCETTYAQSPSLPKTTDGIKVADENTGVSIDFNDVEIRVLIKFISELTGKNFIVDSRVKGNVTVISPSKITIKEAYKVFESVLEVHGFTTVESGEVIKVIPLPDARTRNVETLLKMEGRNPEDKVVTQLIPLQHASGEDVKKLLAPLVSKSSVLMSYPPTNTLILTDVFSNIQRLLRIIEAIDTTAVGNQVAIVQLRNADAAELEAILESIYSAQGKNKNQLAKTLRFVNDSRTNSLIIVGHDEDISKTKELALLLDQKVPRGQERVHVRYLEFAKAENLAQILQEFKSQDKTSDKGKQIGFASDQVKISADQETNSLIIWAGRDDYYALEEIIDKLDIPRPMVYIESLIMEVDAGHELNIGTDWQAIGKTTIDGKETAIGAGFTGGSEPSGNTDGFIDKGTLPLGAAMGIFTEEIEIAGVTFRNLQAVINYFREDKDVKIISTPQLLTTDNEEASIIVGKNIPYQTTTSTSDNDTFNSFEYRDVGTTLDITPQISQGKMVRLSIAHEISKLESSVDSRPTTLKRSIYTTVLVRDASTIVIGGLIDDQVTTTEWKIPFLGDIPILGWLFKSEGKSSEKTNLYIFLTPRVVKTPLEAERIYKDKRDHMQKNHFQENGDLFDKGSRDSSIE